MIRFLLSLFLLYLLPTFVNAQLPEPCATVHVHEAHIAADPTLEERMEQAERTAQTWLRHHPNLNDRTVLTIPVVVHILAVDSTQNLPFSRIQEQIDILNADFRRLNADTSKTRPQFKARSADFEIEFCLASLDPEGNPTNGVVRKVGKPANGYTFSLENEIKRSRWGGSDAWPTDQYLNIWVGPLEGTVIGYGQFPGGDFKMDGIVVVPQAFGTGPDTHVRYNGGRTATHEVGHWLGLRHVWGNYGGCWDDDLVDDTPTAEDPSPISCPFNINSCKDSLPDELDMSENYMDYTVDSCKNAFTEGQKARAWSFLMTDRLSLFTSNGCARTVSRPAQTDGLSQVRAYHSGVDGLIHLQVNFERTTLVNYELRDLQGRRLASGKFHSSKHDLPVSQQQYTAGFYLVRVSANGRQVTRRVLVSR